MCNIWKKEAAGELGLEEIERFFKKSNSFSWVGLTGGEPFLREDIAEVIKIISDNCKELFAIHFATNGTLTDKIMDVIEGTLKYKRNIKLVFTLSIDGPPHLHDEIRGLEGSWARCIGTFRGLRKIKAVRARIGTTLSHYNFDRFPDIFTALRGAYPPLRFDDITINIFHKSLFYYNNGHMPELNYLSIIKAIDRILEMDKDPPSINNFLRRSYLKLYKRYARSKKPPLKCQALSATCLLGPQGDIYPCGIHGLKVASIQEYNYDLGKIWLNPQIEGLSVACSKGACPSCWSPCDAYSAIAGSLFKFNLWRN